MNRRASWARCQHSVERLCRCPDINHDVVGIEGPAPERGVDDVRRAVQALRRPERLAAQTVGDHHVVTDGHTEHGYSPS